MTIERKTQRQMKPQEFAARIRGLHFQERMSLIMPRGPTRIQVIEATSALIELAVKNGIKMDNLRLSMPNDTYAELN